MASRVVIFGGYGGIGLATARLLRSRGVELHLVGRNEQKLAAVAAELDARYTAGDVTDSTLFSALTNDLASEPVDGLVYAVGTINLRSLGRFSADDFILDFKVNAMGAALAVQSLLPALKKTTRESSAIVLYSTVAASQGFTFHASLGMAKGAVNGLVLSLAAELAPKIRVNAVAPSLTRTPLAQGLIGREQMASAIADMHALQRLGEPEDIAEITAFLLGPESAWITGQVIGVDGGRSSLRTKA